jgi:predicted acyl esterase
MGGYQQLVRGEAFRGKFRNSFEKPQPFESGKVAKVEYVMPDIYHTLRKGNRIMVQVQSTWFPLVDRNPQRFCDIYHAKAEDFQKATERVYHSPNQSSYLGVELKWPMHSGARNRTSSFPPGRGICTRGRIRLARRSGRSGRLDRS